MPSSTNWIVNNAGLATHNFQTTPQGFEMTMGVEYVQPSEVVTCCEQNKSPWTFPSSILKNTAAVEYTDVGVVNVRMLPFYPIRY